MSKIYANAASLISGRTFGGSACSYASSVGDLRYVRMLVTPSGDGLTRVLSPNMSLDSVPSAVVAERAENVQGLGAANILQVNTTGSEVLSQVNLENVFSASNYSALTSLLSGSSGLYSKPASNGTTPLANVASPASPSAGQIWYDSGAIKYYNGSATQTLGVAGSGISSLVVGAGLTPTGTITTSGSIAVDVGTTTGQIVQVATGNKLPVIDGSNLTNLPAPTSVSGGAITSGTIGGSTAVNTSGAIATTGNINGATISGTSVVGTTGSFTSTSMGQLSLYDSATTATNYITLKTPNTATLIADYTLVLPAALPGSSGQVLTSDTSGNLTWTSPSSGSVISVGGTAPITVSGTASAPVVNVSAASTAAAGVVTLAASGGTTASTVVQATDSRLADSRAPTGSATGDLSGSYPNPTVSKLNGTALSISSLTTGDHLKYNGTSWINAALSSADLSNDSNLLKASSMPANCTTGSSLTFSSPTGTWVCTTIPDATASSKGIMQVGAGLSVSSGTVSLTSGIVTAGTYPKVTVDTYGRVTAGAALASGDVTAALGYTPVNKAGDVMTGTFGLQSITTATETTVIGSFTATDKGKMWFNSDLKKIHMWDGSAVESIASPPTPTVAQDGQSLKWNNTTKAWDYFTAGAAGAGIGTFNTLTANTQTLAIAAGGTAPNWVSATSTHTLNIPMASTASVTAGLISKADYDNFNTKIGTSSSLTGDVTGTPSTTSVDKIKGKAVTTPTTAGQMLVYDGAGITPVAMSSDATMAATGALTLKNTGTAGTYYKVTTDAQGRVSSGITTLSSADLSNDSNLLKASNMPANCAAGSTLTFSSPTGTWTCTTITGLDGAAITTGTISALRLPASVQYWTSATGGINYSGGNVGIGTTSPVALLDVRGRTAMGGYPSAASTLGVQQQVGDTVALSLSRATNNAVLQFCSGGTGCSYIEGNSGNILLATSGAGTGAGAGNVGIGTATPLGNLHSIKSGTAITDQDSNNETIIEGPNHAFSTAGNLFVVANGAAAAGNGGSISFGAKYSGNNAAAAAMIRSGTVGSYGGYLAMGTRVDGGSMTERLRIDNSGNVGIGTTTPSTALEVNGIVTAANANQDPILSVQPGARYTASVAAGVWTYSGEYITIVVPSGPTRHYRLSVRQLVNSSVGGQMIFALSTSSSSLTGNSWQTGGVPHLNTAAGVWDTINTEGVLTLPPGTYTYYQMFYSGIAGTISIANESPSGRNYSNTMAIPY